MTGVIKYRVPAILYLFLGASFLANDSVQFSLLVAARQHQLLVQHVHTRANNEAAGKVCWTAPVNGHVDPKNHEQTRQLGLVHPDLQVCFAVQMSCLRVCLDVRVSNCECPNE